MTQKAIGQLPPVTHFFSLKKAIAGASLQPSTPRDFLSSETIKSA
jgi:hypothetical protein